MDSGVAFRLLAVLALVLANAFFVAAEFALVAARRTRIREMADAGDRAARRVARAQSDLDRAISGTQLGITLASIGLGWIGEPALARLVEPWMVSLGFGGSPAVVHTVAIAISFILITYLHIVLGELAPKTVALVHPEAVSRWVAGPLIGFNRLMAPWIWVLNSSSTLVLRLFKLPAGSAHERVHSPDEIEMLVSESLREGVVEEDEQAMIQGVFELTRTMVREVMTPRPDIVAVPAATTIPDILSTAASSGFSRLPVYADSIDGIVGIVVVKDLLPRIVAGDDGARADAVMREALFVPDTKPVDDLIAELRHRKTHMAIVIDEFGGTDGIVTLEDLIEEIVGEIYDEHDVAEAELSVGADGTAFLGGATSFSDLLDRFDLTATVQDDEYDTVAGYVLATLGRMPVVGDRVAIGEAELIVRELNERRITRLELRGASERTEPGAEAASSGD
ncbi:MAG: hemolysin family protein [Gemmatimonadota bacterium]|nr:hemolysin family protein [Gemmatimonadota bacterium]